MTERYSTIGRQLLEACRPRGRRGRRAGADSRPADARRDRGRGRAGGDDFEAAAGTDDLMVAYVRDAAGGGGCADDRHAGGRGDRPGAGREAAAGAGDDPERRLTPSTGRAAAQSHRSHVPPLRIEGTCHVLTPRNAGDLQGSSRRQHRHVRVRQPGSARYGDADRELHPARGTRGWAELLPVRGRRAVLDPRRQRRRWSRGHQLRVPLHDRSPEPRDVPLQRGRSAR